MSLRGNLAHNLRRLCTQAPSINAVCRDIGINRQQFERYLTQQATPGQRTLKKICDYFDIAEHDLFADPVLAPMPGGRRGPVRIETEIQRVVAPLIAGPPASLKPGLYHLWLTIPRVPNRLICTVMIIRRDGDTLTFRRITGMGEARSSSWRRFRGDHQGVVVERIGQYFFAAINQRGTTEPSFLRLSWVPMSEAMFKGVGHIFTPAGASIVTAAMRPLPPGATLRDALKASRVYQRSEIDPLDVLLHVIDDQSRETLSTLKADYGLPD